MMDKDLPTGYVHVPTQPGTTAARRWLHRAARVGKPAARHAVLLCLSALFGFPYLWTLSTSLKPEQQLFAYPPQLLPQPFTWQNYVALFQNFPFARYLLNSSIITGLSVLGAVVSCSMVAYSFARLRWPGRDIMFILTLGTMMLPYQVIMVPLYLIFRRLGWVDTWYPLWVPAWFGVPFFIFLLRQFFLTLPHEIEDAAKVDGAGYIRTFVLIVLPLMRPALITVAIFAFMGSWNDFVGPLIYVHSNNLLPVSLGLQYINSSGAYMGQQFYAVLMAGAFCSIIPMVILFLLLQRYFVRGIVMTGLKG